MTEANYRRRRGALAEALGACDQAWACFEDPQQVSYFTGFSILFPGVRHRACLLVAADGRAVLVVSAPLAASAAKSGVEVIPVTHSVVCGRTERDAMFATEVEAVTGHPLSDVQAAATKVAPDVALMRQYKDAEEQAHLRELAGVARAGYAAVRTACVAGASELDLLLAAKAAGVRTLGRDLFVSGDFVSGPRCLEGGGFASPRCLAANDPLIVDLWLISDLHYWSDTCRTLVAGGPPSDRQQATWALLESIKQEAAQAIRPGVKAVTIYWQMQHALAACGRHCPHHLGHGIGLDFWEPPFITADSTDVFADGMAFTLEIGVYAEAETCARFEDNYFVTATGVAQFTDLG